MMTSTFLISVIYFGRNFLKRWFIVLDKDLILHVRHAQLEMSFELVLPKRQIVTFLVNL